MRMTEDEYAALLARRAEDIRDTARQLGCPVPRNARQLADDTIPLSSKPVKLELAIPTEDWEQRMLAQYLDILFRDGSVKWAHVPNGGNRDQVTAAKLKGHGVKPGVPDVLIFAAPPLLPESPGVAIELKRRQGGKTSPEQREWLEHLENQGWCCSVCKGWEEAREFLAGLGWKE